MDSQKKIDMRRVRVPACSIQERDEVVTVTLEMPGVAKDDLEVKIEGNQLAISGDRRPENLEGRYLLRERRAESYRKVFTMDDSIAREKIEAGMADGILTLRLHVKEAAKPRRIDVR